MILILPRAVWEEERLRFVGVDRAIRDGARMELRFRFISTSKGYVIAEVCVSDRLEQNEERT